MAGRGPPPPSCAAAAGVGGAAGVDGRGLGAPFMAWAPVPRCTAAAGNGGGGSKAKGAAGGVWPREAHVRFQRVGDGADDEEDAICAICFDPTTSVENEIVFCDGCNVAVHQACYGVDDIPEDEWFCVPCTAHPAAPAASAMCQLCPVVGGALVPIPSNAKGNKKQAYVHGSCALYTPGANLLPGPTADISGIHHSRLSLSCGVCGHSGGGTLQCAFPKCRAAFHAHCLESRGGMFEFRHEHAVRKQERNGYWGPVAFCPAHASDAHAPERNRYLGTDALETGDAAYQPATKRQNAINAAIRTAVELAKPRRAAWILSHWGAFERFHPPRNLHDALTQIATPPSESARALAAAAAAAALPTPTPPRRQARSLEVGERVTKRFEQGVFTGTITAVSPRTTYPYTVTYEDGDVESYTRAQILELNVPNDTPQQTPQQTPQPQSQQQQQQQQPRLVTGGAMRPYQLEGLRWLLAQHDALVGGVLGDEMGLGKTLQVISFLAALKEKKEGGPHLIVAPLSVLPTWVSEIRRWCPTMRAVAFHGNQQERNRVKHGALANPSGFDIVVTTYEMLVAEQPWLTHRFHFRYLVLDEAQRIKNEASLAGVAVRRMRKAATLLLTGTPLQNDLHELWALLNVLFPDVLASSEAFDEGKAAFQATSAAALQASNPALVRAARDVLEPCMLRRTKAQVLAHELPPLTTVRVACPMAPLQRLYYKRVLEFDGLFGKLVAATTTSNPPGSQPFRQLSNLMMQLRKVANHPFQLNNCEEPGADPDEPADERIWLASGKLQVLDGVLARMQAEGRKCIVFSQFTGFLDVIERALEHRGHRYLRLDGSTPAARRAYEMRRFNAPGSPFVAYLVSSKAGGLGLNLQAADTVILADSDWNPNGDLQAQARAHRIGQSSPVTVLRLVSAGTCEERILAFAEAKLKLAAAVLEGQAGAGVADDDDAPPGSGELLAAIQAGAAEALAGDADGLRAAVNAGTRVVDPSYVDDIMRAAAAAAAGNDGGNGGSECGGGGAVSVRPRGDDADAAAAAATKSVMEWEGHTFGRDATNKRTIADVMAAEAEAQGKRSRASTVVMVSTGERGVGVQAVSKQSILDAEHIENMEKRHAARIAAKKLKAAEGGNRHSHEVWCVGCAKPLSGREEDRHRGALTLKAAREAPSAWLGCPRCPRAACAGCAAMMSASSSVGSGFGGWSCPQHACGACGRSASDAGGLLFRCVGCRWSRCWDCGKDAGFAPEDNMAAHAWAQSFGFPQCAEKASSSEYVTCSECLSAAPHAL